MPLPLNPQTMSAGVLLDAFKVSCQELGILMVSDAPEAELLSAQATVDMFEAECGRRMAW
jgi:hypothetical protein